MAPTISHRRTDPPRSPRPRGRWIARSGALVALAVPAAVAGGLLASLTPGSSGVGSSSAAPGVSLPSDQHYRAAVEALLRHPDTRLASVTVSGADGTTRVVRARGRSGFPASYLNPLGIAETGRALAGTDELIQIKEMRLAQRPDGHLVWRLAGRRDDNGAWAALIAPNGTGLRTIAPARR